MPHRRSLTQASWWRGIFSLGVMLLASCPLSLGDPKKMSGSIDIYRDSCKQLHLTLGAFFACWAWCRGADCVVVDRKILGDLPGLEKIHKSRIEQIRQDIWPWFPYISILFTENDSVRLLCLSRRPIDDCWLDSKLSDRECASNMTKNGVATIVYDDPSTLVCSESGMVAELSLWVSGRKAPPATRRPTRTRKKNSLA